MQARLAGELLAYPRGKSAMVYYDADSDLSQALARLEAVVPPGSDVLVRFAEAAAPAAELARLVAGFERRFGAPPAWNPLTGTCRP